MKIKPMAIVLTMLAGWINRQQSEVIEYLLEGNEILREKIGSKRILLNKNEKHRLAVLGKKLGRKLLGQVCCAFSPDTILRWNRELVLASMMEAKTAVNTADLRFLMRSSS